MLNTSTFNEFYTQAWRFCKPRLRKLTSNEADVEDVFAEAIARFWVNSQQGKVQHNGNHEALVYVMARNLWLGNYRKNKGIYLDSIDAQTGLEAELQIADNELDMLNGWIATADKTEQDEAINKAWQKLDEKCQTLLTATIVYKEKQEDLAEKLGMKNTDTIKASKYRCLQYLKKFYYQFAA
jgi:RNA polymerase sigma factor (sigma-70 family)